MRSHLAYMRCKMTSARAPDSGLRASRLLKNVASDDGTRRESAKIVAALTRCCEVSGCGNSSPHLPPQAAGSAGNVSQMRFTFESVAARPRILSI
jgi:hypothetical protein